MFCSQPATLDDMSRGRRWVVFIIGILETMVWSGTVFGWASLVHVLKTYGVYSNLCGEASRPVYSSSNVTDGKDVLLLMEEPQVSCSSQDQQFALIYTVACVVYAIPGILIGYCLHHLGLAVTRVMGGLLVSSGFILLALTTADSPSFLWGAAVFLSVGGNTIRMAGLQFGNLFPKRRNTAMAIISGMFTPSAGIFIILQYASEAGVSWVYTCLGFAGAASLVLVATCVMPRHHVPYNDSDTDQNDNTKAIQEQNDVTKTTQEHNDATETSQEQNNVMKATQEQNDVKKTTKEQNNVMKATQEQNDVTKITKEQNDVMKTTQEQNGHSKMAVEQNESKQEQEYISRPVKDSYLSWSNAFHTYWVFSNMFAVVLFSTYFNSWINRFSKTTEEAAHYSRLYGLANMCCFFVSPLPGLLVDALCARFTRGKSGLDRHIASVQAAIIPMLLVTSTVTIQLASLMFQGSAAVYIGLVCLSINRPSCLAVGNPLIRIRFPADHFNRIIGFQGTMVSILTLLQYPHFTWAQYQYYVALGVMVGALILNTVHPLHLISKTYLARVLAPVPTTKLNQDKPVKV